MKSGKIALFVLIFYFFSISGIPASEVLEDTTTQVVVREHPKTKKPYVSIVSNEGSVPEDPLRKLRSDKLFRPDYRLLDPKIKAKEVPYEGPVSDRKKVYLFAATLATVGAVGGTAIIAAAPAATGAGSGAGAGVFAAGGAAVTGGTVAASIKATNPDPDKDKVIYTSKSQSTAPDRAAER